MDDDWRTLQRACEASSEDQGLLAALIQARRRAGLPVPESLLDHQVFPARTFDAPFESTVRYRPPREPDDILRELGNTPCASGLVVPEHREWRIAIPPEALEAAVMHLAADVDPPGLLVHGTAGLAQSTVSRLASVARLRWLGVLFDPPGAELTLELSVRTPAPLEDVEALLRSILPAACNVEVSASAA